MKPKEYIEKYGIQGGKQEDFVLLTEHKNKCISWAKKNKF